MMRIDGDASSLEGELQLRVGAASPEVGDVSDEEADEDGALITAGYASLTPIKGPHEDADPAIDELMHSALATIGRHLERLR